MQAEHKLYGCPGCGDITTGTRSPVREYDCCPGCIDRQTGLNREWGDADDDPGPFEERGKFPPCPKCGKDDTDSDLCEYRLVCMACDYTWIPDGIYDKESNDAQ